MATVERKLHTFDATGERAGRLASRIAKLLQGKHKPQYLPYIDMGDAVAVTNIARLEFSGKKKEQKAYYRPTGYLGGLKTIPLKRILAENPKEALRHAVRLMLPKNKLRNGRLKRLKIT